MIKEVKVKVLIRKDIFLKGLESSFFDLDDFLTISEGTEELSLEDFAHAGQQELVAGNFLEVSLVSIILREDSEGHVVR